MLSLLPVLLIFFFQEAEPETCLPCGDGNHAGVTEVREKLGEAFRLSMTAADCSGRDNFQTCRAIEGFLEEAFEALDGVIAEGEAGGSIDCISCDPFPHLSPLFGTFEAVATLLVERGYGEFTGKWASMQQRMELWKGYSCCGATRSRRTPNREMDARAVLTEKCGSNFERNRQGLRQVVRMPGDREGCYQSRACREATQYNGQFLEAGYWTYDGEYWYIWEQRRTPRGEWVPCN